jgi:hypothetical protein
MQNMTSSADTPEYLADYAHLRAAALEVGSMISEVQPRLSELEEAGATFELEGRLGRLGPLGFDPNVGSAAFCTINSMLDTFPRWSHVTKWEETQDVFFTTILPAAALQGIEDTGRPVQVRSSVCSSPTGVIEIVHMVKKKLRRVDLALQNVDVGACALGTRAAGCAALPLDARVATSIERQVPSEFLPVAVSTDLVRIKQRKRFFLPSLGVPKDCFSFDLTIVYSGTTKTEAETNQRKNENASFEVECECLAPRDYLKTSGDPICLGLSVIVKLLDFASALNPASSVTFVPPHSKFGERSHSNCHM